MMMIMKQTGRPELSRGLEIEVSQYGKPMEDCIEAVGEKACCVRQCSGNLVRYGGKLGQI